MKYSKLLGTCAAVLATVSLIQAQATSPIVGYVSKTITGAGVTTFSTTLKNPADITGLSSGSVASTPASNQIMVTSAGWDVNFPTAAQPYFVRLLGGTVDGLLLQITSNTADTLTVASDVDLTGATLATFEIVEGDTLESLFGATTITTGASSAVADSIFLRGPTSWSQYYLNNTNEWKLVGGFGDVTVTNVVITPGSGVLINSVSGADFTVTNVGSVSQANSTLPIRDGASELTFFSTGFPTDQLVSSLGLESVLTAAAGSGDRDNADIVFVRGPSSWSQLYYDSNLARWSQIGGFGDTDATNFSIPANTPILLLSRSGTSSTFNVVTFDNPDF